MSGEPCIVCGKPLAMPAGYVHLSTGGGYLPLGAADHPDSQGMFPVGSDCARQLRQDVVEVQPNG